MRKKKVKNNKMKFEEFYRAKRNVEEGERIFKLMKEAMLSADATIGGTVAMNYALGKAIACYKRAMRSLDIEVDVYLESMSELCDFFMPEEDRESMYDFRVYTEKVLTNEMKKTFLAEPSGRAERNIKD